MAVWFPISSSRPCREPITVYGNGCQTWSFCYVDDLIEGIVKLMNTSKEMTGPINLGNPSEYTILELAQKVIQLTNSNSEIIFEPLPEDDPKKRQPDIILARKILDWESKVSLEEGLKRTIVYFDEILRLYLR